MTATNKMSITLTSERRGHSDVERVKRSLSLSQQSK
jgi:hypothetical protein